MKLYEVLNKSAEIKWNDYGGIHQAEFKTSDGKPYAVDFYPQKGKQPGTYYIEFKHYPEPLSDEQLKDSDAVEDNLTKRFGASGAGNQFEVLSTYKNAVQQFIQNHNPAHLEIISQDPASRKIRDAMIKRYGQDWEASHDPEMSSNYVKMSRK